MGRREAKKEQITEQRRKQILQAALTVFSRESYGEATVPEITREAGVAVGTIYNYYESKRDLLLAVLADAVRIGPLIELLDHPEGEDEGDLISKLIDSRLRIGFQSVDRLWILLSEIRRDHELRERYLRRVVEPVLARLQSHMASRIASGVYRPLKTEVAAVL